MNFHVGQKVVCVDDAPPEVLLSVHPWSYEIARGTVYTIRWVGRYQLRYKQKDWGVPILGLRLCGIIRPRRDTPFLYSRFRPVKTTDISIFIKMLAPTPKEREPA